MKSEAPKDERPGEESIAGAETSVEGQAGSVLRNRQFVLLWMAQAVSQTAQNAIWFGLMVVVEDATHSSTHLSIAVLSTILPAIFLGMLAGVFVDRMNKKTVLVTTNVLRGVAVLGYLLYSRAIGFVYLVNLLTCSIGQFFAPAEAATIPQLVPKRQLITANSLFNLTFAGSQMAGLVLLGPPILKLFGPQTLFIGAGLAYLVAAVFVSFLPPSPPHRPLKEVREKEVVGSVWSDVKEVWLFIHRDRKTGLAIVHLMLVSGLVLLISMLAPRYVVDVVQVRADDAVYMFAPAGLGILLGTTLAGRLTGRFGKSNVVHCGLLTMGCGMIVLSLLEGISRIFPHRLATMLGTMELQPSAGMVPAMLFFAAIIGFSFAMVTIPAQTVIMERAPAASRGRVFSVQIMLGNVASVFPLVFLGGVADVFGVNSTMAIVGIVILLVAAYSISATRQIALLRVEVVRGNRPADVDYDRPAKDANAVVLRKGHKP